MSPDNQRVVADLRRRFSAGATFVELVDAVHAAAGVLPYRRGIVLLPFAHAFDLRPLDFANIVFACELFGDGATVSVEETEKAFRRRVSEIGSVP